MAELQGPAAQAQADALPQAQPTTASSCEPVSAVYAVARVGAHHVAIVHDVVAQAVTCPERLLTLPRRSGALEGLFSWRGQWVPVVHLDRWLALGEAPAPDPRDMRILVLSHHGQVIGLRVDAVMGVRTVRAAELARVYRDEAPDELFQSVIAAAGQQPALGVLEAARLMHLAAAWCEVAALKPGQPAQPGAAAPALGPQAGDASRQMPYATFGIGDLLVGIPAADVGELIPCPPLQATMPGGSAARGICTWRGRFVPVVDLCEALGATAPDTAAASVCMVCHGELAIGVLVSRVGGLCAVDAARVERRSGRDAMPEVLLGVSVLGDDLTLQVLDSAGLMACFPETALSAARGARSEAARDETTLVADAFIVFDTGTLRAMPARQVQEVVEIPASVRARLDAGQRCTLEWRGHAVPVTDLRGRLKGVATMNPSHLVIVCDGERRAAVTIAGVQELIPARTAS